MKYSVIIPVYNNFELTDNCLSSLQSTDDRGEIIVVDNGSTDETSQMLAEKHPNVRYIRLSENKGYPIAVNTGLRESQFNLLILMNNDIIAHPEFWERIGAVTPETETSLIGQTGGMLDHNAVFRNSVREQDGIYPTFIEGYLLFFNRQLLQRVGYLDEAFSPYYADDSDFSIRAQQIGYSLRLIDGLVTHLGGATTQQQGDAKYWSDKNTVYLHWKWFDLFYNSDTILHLV